MRPNYTRARARVHVRTVYLNDLWSGPKAGDYIVTIIGHLYGNLLIVYNFWTLSKHIDIVILFNF